MKTSLRNFSVLPMLIAGLGLQPAARVTAQAFTTLHSFTALNYSTNSDGANPVAGLTLSGNILYGTANLGGNGGGGTVFAVNTDGSGFTNLYDFITYSDADWPDSGLFLSGNTLYGSAHYGVSGDGAAFAVNTNGSNFTTFHLPDGSATVSFLSGNTLYGTSFYGGHWGDGAVFKLNIDGTSFTNVYSFNYANYGGSPDPSAVILSSNTLYGTTYFGGGGSGSVFAVKTDGTDFTNLYNFTGISDGASPYGGLILLGDILYGTCSGGGSHDAGTVFAVNTDGSGFTNLHSFSATSGSLYTNSDGAEPSAGLLLSGNTLYGTCYVGGNFGAGTVFAVNTDGSGFTNLYTFTGGSDGASPYAALILSGNTLYGTALNGGSSSNGTVFSLSLGSIAPPPPKLTIIKAGINVILTWPTNAAGFTLQSTTILESSPVWTTNSSIPVVVNGQNTLTNPILGTQQLFRLSQ